MNIILGKDTFYSYLLEEKELNNEAMHQLEEIVERHPYFQTAQMMLLKCKKGLDDSSLLSYLEGVSIICHDREKLYYYLNDSRYARFFPKKEIETKLEDRTSTLLDSFLQSLDEEKKSNENNDDKQEGDTMDTSLLENDSIISSDYMAYLEHTQLDKEKGKDDKKIESKPLKHQQLVDRFLEKSGERGVLFGNKNIDNNRLDKASATIQENNNLLEDDTFLTETLAQVYIKQKKYEQALTIIKRLSLNFPKKSIYFADQIRFLEYLIINDKNKK